MGQEDKGVRHKTQNIPTIPTICRDPPKNVNKPDHSNLKKHYIWLRPDIKPYIKFKRKRE